MNHNVEATFGNARVVLVGRQFPLEAGVEGRARVSKTTDLGVYADVEAIGLTPCRQAAASFKA